MSLFPLPKGKAPKGWNLLRISFVDPAQVLSLISCPQFHITQKLLSYYYIHELLIPFWESHFSIHGGVSYLPLDVIIHSMTFLNVWVIQARISSLGASPWHPKVGTRPSQTSPFLLSYLPPMLNRDVLSCWKPPIINYNTNTHTHTSQGQRHFWAGRRNL